MKYKLTWQADIHREPIVEEFETRLEAQDAYDDLCRNAGRMNVPWKVRPSIEEIGAASGDSQLKKDTT